MLLEVEALQTYIQQFHILQGVSLHVDAGEIVVLLGRNGAGKTTTLRSIMGLTSPYQGRILFNGNNITGLPAYEIARQGIGFVPEDQAIFSGLTVSENFKVAMMDSRRTDRIDFVLDLFPDLKHALGKRGGELSGGQKQMLAIARALLNENRLILVDEPSKGLAPIVVEKLADSLLKMRQHTTVLLVEQNFNFAAKIGDRFYIIDDGRTIHQGQMDELRRDTELQQRYLGIARSGGR